MIPQNFEYEAPRTLEEALQLLADGSAKPLAGGMSLIPLMKLRLAAPERVVDLGRIPGLSYIREEDGAIRIGAMTTHYEIESSPVLKARCPLLAATAAQIGDMQVRNVGTIGGSLAHADPAADYPAALLALEAQVRLARAGAERTVAITDFFTDVFTTALEPGEIVREVIVPAETPGTGVSYQKVAHPASGFAVVGIAARVRRSEGRITMARLGVTGLAAKPFRAIAAEKLLEGSSATEADVRAAAGAVPDGVEANSDLYASAEYRTHLARVYAARALRAALQAA
ncbi:MAG TPA: xanthine dehydrogenase family protein subunit M [Bryobacteraceae bacterium]|nr:xanthine dehydrogenase family protein subunit M [Bryobacteraceae bacterium]